MAYRSSMDDVSYREDSRRSTERWDRDRFERYGRRPVDERDSFRYEERDRYDGGRDRRTIDVDDEYERRGPRVIEKDRYYEDDRYDAPRRRRPEFLDDPVPAEVANRALAPYRRKSIIEEDVEYTSRRPQRPGYLRRQSSLDTFDRRALPRYDEHDREWRPPTNMPIPLPVRERVRRESSPRRVYRDDEYERVRYRENDGNFHEDFREADYQDVSIRSDKGRHHRRRSSARSSRARSHGRRSSRASSRSSSSSPSPVRQIGKRGRTRLPKRLAELKVVVDKGYPYEEEGDFIVVKRALEKEHIDEIIKLSESYRETKSTYVYEDDKSGNSESITTDSSTTTIVAPAAPESVRSRRTSRSTVAPPPSIREHSSHHEMFEEDIDESATVRGPLGLIAPHDRHSRSEREIKDEIRSLEAERALLKYEREDGVEVIERRPKDVVRVEKGRKGKMALVRSSH